METKKITRVEVIDHTPSDKETDPRGRVFVKKDAQMKVEIQLQDDGKTLKVFLKHP